MAGDTVAPTQTLDVKGKACPLPVIKTAGAIRALRSGDVLEVLATDPGIESDMPAWARQTGNELLSIERLADSFRVLVRKA